MTSNNDSKWELEEKLKEEGKRLGWTEPYDQLQTKCSDNEYLYYLHHRVGWMNNLLSDIKAMLWWTILRWV